MYIYNQIKQPGAHLVECRLAVARQGKRPPSPRKPPRREGPQFHVLAETAREGYAQLCLICCSVLLSLPVRREGLRTTDRSLA